MWGACAAAQASDEDLASMLGALAARGPDGAIAHVDRRREIALGVRAPAHGVLRGDDGSLLCVDGRIFNELEVRAWLSDRGRSHSGAHPNLAFLHLYEHAGAPGFRFVDGQFAGAIWDARSGEIVLFRDFLGVRPLYYAIAPGPSLVFASEIKALLALPQIADRAEIDEVALSHYLTFLAVPGPRTLWKGIHKLPPGSFLRWRPGRGAPIVEKYADLLDDPIEERSDERYYVERTRELMEKAVRARMPDGPVAAMLSGGNDSSANVALLRRNGCGPLHTFTVGLEGAEGQSSYNDLEYARRVAKLVGSEHHESLLSVEQFLALIPESLDAMDDLVSEPSSVFLLHALRMARREGLKVVITGEANDELCCGHGEMIRIRDHYYRRWQPIRALPSPLRRLAAALAPAISPRRAEVLRRAANGDEYFWSFEIGWMESEKATILSPDVWARVRDDGPGEVVRRCAERVRRSAHGERDYLDYIVYSMMQDHYFGNLMLGKLDLLASHESLEPRCPYTSPAYAHFVYNVPARFKTRGGLVKSFFKKALDGILPDEIVYRPKQGFRTPVVELFQGRLGGWARPALLERGLTRAGVLRRDHLQGLLDAHRRGEADHSNRLWTAMILNLWHERWLRRERTTRVARPAVVEAT